MLLWWKEVSKMKDIKEKVEEMEREVFELKALDVEDAAFTLLDA